MTHDLLVGLSLFALASSLTPGPNNLMLMASGANYGFRRTLPHLFGVGLGFFVMIVLVGTGISELFQRYPMNFHILRVASVLYLGYLALKLVGRDSSAMKSDPANGSGGDQTRNRESRPMTFFQAALFQWINPKAWAMALTAVSVYAPAPGFFAVALVAFVFGLINLPSVGLWAFLGQHLRGLLHDDRHLQRFNATMAILLLASLLPLVRV